MSAQEVASAVSVDCRTSNLPQLVADTNGEPAILFGGIAKLGGALVREHLEEAIRLLRMHDLGATVYPEWRENPTERRYTVCTGSGEFTDRTLPVGVTEAFCPLCFQWCETERVGSRCAFAVHTRSLEPSPE